MKEAEKKALIAIPIVVLIGVGVALAGSQGVRWPLACPCLVWVWRMPLC